MMKNKNNESKKWAVFDRMHWVNDDELKYSGYYVRFEYLGKYHTVKIYHAKTPCNEHIRFKGFWFSLDDLVYKDLDL